MKTTYTDISDGWHKVEVEWIASSGARADDGYLKLWVDGELYYLLGDHLGSSSVTVDDTGTKTGEQWYFPFGETRYSEDALHTGYQYTGQYNEVDLGLMFYKARFYDSYLNHFTQPDTIIPDPKNPQDWNRYAYTRYNPVNYTDPGGHIAEGAYGYGNENRTNYPFLTDWEKNFGLDIASNAIGIYEKKDDYYVWGYADNEGVGYAPPPTVLPKQNDRPWNTYAGNIESLNKIMDEKVPLVCADIPILANHNTGIELYGGNWDDLYSDYGTHMSERSVTHLEGAADVTKTWGAGLEYGDTVLSSQHAAVIVDFSGSRDDPSKIWVVQTSGTQRDVTVITLAEFSTRTGESHTTFSYLQFWP